jgi:D-arabinose 1-dehydrogenase-like Zn-dependent alcohol dehydrogenase
VTSFGPDTARLAREAVEEKLRTETKVPKPKPNGVMVNVTYAGVVALDWLTWSHGVPGGVTGHGDTWNGMLLPSLLVTGIF